MMTTVNGVQPKRALIVGTWDEQGVAVPTVRSGHGDRGADLEWRAQADEGGCADWGLAFARIPAAPQRASRREKRLGVIALMLIAIGAALLLIAEGRIVWPL